MTDKRLPKPESLEAKLMLLCRLPYDRRAKRKHILVFGFILDWYHDKYGNALASVRHITDTLKERDPAGRGLYQGDVHAALTDLVAWGYLDQIKGAGRQASRYVPAWNLVCVRETPNTNGDEPSVRENTNTSVRENTNTTVDSVRETPNEDPLTGPGQQTGSHVMGNMFEAAPWAPLAVGSSATAADTASGGFESFWKVWPRKHGIRKARAEWAKLSGDPATIIEAASAWAAHYKEHSTDKKWIPEPANWLAGERWLEDLPIIHGDAKGAAIAKAKANAPAKPKAEPANSNGRTMRIVSTDSIGDPFSDWGLRVTMEDEAGERHEFTLRSILTAGSNGPDADLYRMLDDANGLQPGARVRIQSDGNRLVDIKPTSAGRRLVEICDAGTDDGESVYANMIDPQGKPEGRLDLDKAGLAGLCDVLGIINIQDTDELLFKRFVVDEHGKFLPALSELKEAA